MSDDGTSALDRVNKHFAALRDEREELGRESELLTKQRDQLDERIGQIGAAIEQIDNGMGMGPPVPRVPGVKRLALKIVNEMTRETGEFIRAENLFIHARMESPDLKPSSFESALNRLAQDGEVITEGTRGNRKFSAKQLESTDETDDRKVLAAIKEKDPEPVTERDLAWVLDYVRRTADSLVRLIAAKEIVMETGGGVTVYRLAPVGRSLFEESDNPAGASAP